jgi:uncharacterized protein YegP (UPF0339 family)
MGKFIMTKRLNGEFQFSLKSNNGLVILTSEGYSTKANCENGIEAVKHYSQEESRFEKCTASNEKYYFNLKSANGQVIGTSQMYGSEFGVEKGIASVRNNAADAKTEDKTFKRLVLSTS